MSKLYFRYGAMGSGKTTALLQVAHNYNDKHMKILLIKPDIDKKGEDYVVSRLGIKRKVDVLLNKGSLFKQICLDDIKAIIVDEAQFLLPKQVDELYFISKEYDIPVLCYGLRCDFQMNGFPGSERLLLIADEIEELKTICKCGLKATQNLRHVDGIPTFKGEQVLIDGTRNTVTYEGVCGKCYLKIKHNSEVNNKLWKKEKE